MSAPAFNIEIHVSEERAVEIAKVVATEFEFEEIETYDELRVPEYALVAPDQWQSSSSRSPDKIWMRWESSGNEYTGNGKQGLTIHYSPYYSEMMETLNWKLNRLNQIHVFLAETVAVDAVHFEATICTV